MSFTATSLMRLVGLGAIAASAALSGCRSQSSALKEATVVGGTQLGACNVNDFQTGGSADLSHDQSSFAALVLNKPNVKFTPSTGSNPLCPTTIHEVLSAFEALPGSRSNIFEVDEIGDMTQNRHSDGHHRFVVVQQVGPNHGGFGRPPQADLLLAPLEAQPGQLDTANLEVISFDAKAGVNQFYKFMNGRWNAMGNGAQIDPAKTQDVTADSGQFFCQSCHPTGALNFKERTLPWNNWNEQNPQGNANPQNDPGTRKLPPFAAPADALLDHWINGDGELDLGSPYDFEGIVENGNRRLVHARVGHVLSGDAPGSFPGQSLKTLVRALMCDVGEVNLASALTNGRGSFDAAPSFLPPVGFIVDLNLPTLAGAINNHPFTAADALNKGMRIDGAAYAALIANQTLPDVPGANDNMHAFFTPIRSFVDDAVGSELKLAKWLTTENLAAILLTDFTTPVFSAQRCALAETIPGGVNGTDPSDPARGRAAFIGAWSAALTASALPGAKGLAARLSGASLPAAFEGRVAAFVTACDQRSKADAANYARDLLALAQQRREELRQDAHLNRGNRGFPQIVESPDLFPTVSPPAVPGTLHLQEDCTLGTASPVIE